MREMFQYLGKKGLLSVGDIQFYVTITDVKMNYGRINVLVVPELGKGETWVSLDRVKVIDK